jgi:hypothetical protein
VSPRTASLIFVAVGAVHLAVGLVMLFAPGLFYEGLATFPPRNDHYTRDLGTFYVALGVAFAAAARRPPWRGAVLLLAVVEYALHTADHVYDIGRPPEDWVGPVTAALVAAGLILLAVLAYAVGRRSEPDSDGAE